MTTDLDVKCSTETHCGIVWECFTIKGMRPAYFSGDTWCVEYNKEGDCWTLWNSLDRVFESTTIVLVFMVARELILEDFANGFIPSWRM